MKERSVEELEGSLVRFATENSSYRKNLKKAFTNQVDLENAIRKHATGACDCLTEKECLARLYRLVPVSQRKMRI